MQSVDLKVVNGAAAGAWIKPRLGGEFGAVTRQVPQDFEAYARVFHPASDRELNPVSWADVAKACGTTAHREMQWDPLIGRLESGDYPESKWSGLDPSEGAMDIDTLDSLCEILAAHTADPAHCFFGLCTILNWKDSFTKTELRWRRLLWLPLGRRHIVLAGPLSAVDQIVEDLSKGGFQAAFHEEDGEPPTEKELAEEFKSRGSPNLIWPADHSWLVATEVDFDSTLVGGNGELVKAIVASPKLEAWEVEPTTSLAEGADRVNLVEADGG